jgi:hypothetical protein
MAYLDGNLTTNSKLLDNNEIVIYSDHTSPMYHFFTKVFLSIYNTFVENLLIGCNVSQRLSRVP